MLIATIHNILPALSNGDESYISFQRIVIQASKYQVKPNLICTAHQSQ